MSWLDSILTPIRWAVAWIMYLAHEAGVLLHVPEGMSWILSIVVLVVIMRVIMIPLFVKQIRSSRGMQLLQPDLRKIQQRYKGKTDPVSRRRMQEETMALYRKNGSNPMSGCWPVLAQSPLFLALFRVLYSLGPIAEGKYSSDAIGPITKDVALQIQQTKLAGAPLSATFLDPQSWAGAAALNVRLVTVVLIILMSVTTFTTQRQLTMKNLPESAKDNPMFRTQKIMLVAMPVIFAVTGVNFPIGVLIYWLTTNLWSMGQQFIVIRNMPSPGSEAEARMLARKARRAARKGLNPEEAASGDGAKAGDAGRAAAAPPRVQPKKTTRAQRRSGPLQAANPSPAADAPRVEAEPSDTAPDQTGAAKHAQADGAQKGSAAAGRQQPKRQSRAKRKKK
ncbi:MAG: membrane protein insertase YidC [Bifidobacteriaceae bacterium]|jgi:YidC/Oxa1 family membrane protein insertase|nr:membrane protein insertase YidC [Bifidobacteriaceae bacterium]